MKRTFANTLYLLSCG